MGGFAGLIAPVASLLTSAFGGSSAKTDRKHQLAGYGDLMDMFKYGFGHGKQVESEGENTVANSIEQMGGPAAYYRSLLTGGRPAALSAVAPTVNTINSQADANSRAIAASGTARGGGVNEAGQNLQTEKMSAVDNAVTGARTTAAPGAAAVAGATGTLGSAQLQAALRLMGMGGDAATSLTSIAAGSRPQSQAMHDDKIYDIGQSLAAILTNPMLKGLPGFGADKGTSVGGI